METRRSEWGEEKDFTENKVRDVALKNYNNLLTWLRWSTDYPKDDDILALVLVAQNLADESKKSYEKSNTSNRDTNRGEPAYIRDLPPWILEEPKGVVVNITKYGNNTGGSSNTVMEKVSGSVTSQNIT